MPTSKAQKLTEYLSVISEPNRLAILQFLKGGERCACEIHPKLGLPQNLSSHHLKVLKDMGLLMSRREGTKIVYARDEAVIARYQSTLTKEITK